MKHFFCKNGLKMLFYLLSYFEQYFICDKNRRSSNYRLTSVDYDFDYFVKYHIAIFSLPKIFSHRSICSYFVLVLKTIFYLFETDKKKFY